MSATIDPQAVQLLRSLQRPGKPCVLSQVVSLFERDAPRQVQAIEAALARGELELAGQQAHGLKSSAANLGAVAVTRQCQLIEASAREGELEACREQSRGLSHNLSEACAELLGYCQEVL